MKRFPRDCPFNCSHFQGEQLISVGVFYFLCRYLGICIILFQLYFYLGHLIFKLKRKVIIPRQ